MKSLMGIIMVVMTGNCMATLQPGLVNNITAAAPVVGGIAHPVARRPIVKIAIPTQPMVPGSPAWIARLALYYRETNSSNQ